MSSKWSSQILGRGSVNFADLLKDEYSVVLLQGKNTFGDMIYCYVKVSLPNMEKLQTALKLDGLFNPSDFGEVIAAAKGEPTPEVRAELARLYPMFDTPRMIHQPTAAAEATKKAWDEY
jgi:hypothetical protein